MRQTLRVAALLLAAFVVAALPGTTSASTTPVRLATASEVDPFAPILLPLRFDDLFPYEVVEEAPSEPPAPAVSIFEGTLVISVYGHPGYCSMGELGCHDDAAGAIEAVRDLAAEYEAAIEALGLDLVVTPALHLIVDVAQAGSGDDGRYLEQMPLDEVQAWVDAARVEGIPIFLDIQVGWSDLHEDVARLRSFLEQPFVHLAVDPEFMTEASGYAPGKIIGTLGAEDVNWLQAYLAEIVREGGLPPKALVLHQFHTEMLADPGDYDDVPEVEITIDMDGWGPPWPKSAHYDWYALAPYSERPAIKLFEKWDDPLMSPADVLALSAVPAYLIYQ